VPGTLDDQFHSDCRRQVEDGVALVHELADDGRREDRLDREMEVRVLREVEDVRFRARREVV
jgi:hypothetical protein